MKKKTICRILIAAGVLAVFSAAFIIAMPYLNATNTVKDYSSKMLSFEDSTIGVDITVQNESYARLLAGINIAKSQKKTAVYAQTMDTSSDEISIQNTKPVVIIDGSTMYIKTDVLKELVKMAPELSLDEILLLEDSDYISMYLPAYLLPSFDTEKAPGWVPPAKEGIDVLAYDFGRRMDVPKATYKDGAYVIEMDSVELADTIKRAAGICSDNSAQCYISVQGVLLNYVVQIRQSAVHHAKELSDYANMWYMRTPESILDGSSLYAKKISEYGDKIAQWVLDNNVKLQYSIWKDNGTYTLQVILNSDKGTISATITKVPQVPEIRVPDSAVDLEEALHRLHHEEPLLGSPILNTTGSVMEDDSVIND